MASFYAVFHGPEGLKGISPRCLRNSVRPGTVLVDAGFTVEPAAFFDTITVDVGLLQKGVIQAAVNEGINLRPVGKTKVGISFDERTRRETTEAVWRAFGIERADNDLTPEYRIPDENKRPQNIWNMMCFT